MDTLPTPAREHAAQPDSGTRHSITLLGGLITLVSAFWLFFLTALAALLAMVLFSAAGGLSDEYPSFLDCRTQVCADESTLGAWAAVAFVVLVIAALRLAYVGTDRALKLVAIGSFIVAAILLLFLLDLWNESVASAQEHGYDPSFSSFSFMLLIPAGPLLLGFGSLLRLYARPAAS